jgi:hypothetical protein
LQNLTVLINGFGNATDISAFWFQHHAKCDLLAPISHTSFGCSRPGSARINDYASGDFFDMKKKIGHFRQIGYLMIKINHNGLIAGRNSVGGVRRLIDNGEESVIRKGNGNIGRG